MNQEITKKNSNICFRLFLILFKGVLLLFAVSVVSFALIRSSPIDPLVAYKNANPSASQEQIDRMVAYWGLEEPPVTQFVNWFTSVLRGDLGYSTIFRQPVGNVILERVQSSIALMAAAWVLSGIFGFFLGLVAAANKRKLVDRMIKAICLTLSSTPTFWVGMIMIMVFAVNLGWFPIGLSAPAGKMIEDVTILERIKHLILPSITLSIVGVSGMALHTREKLIGVLESDYALFAFAQGEKKWTVIRRHGLRNILLPAITLQFASFSELFGGSVLAETVFSYPGLGSAASRAGNQNDISLFLGITLFSALFVYFGNLSANLLYFVIDPRTKEKR